LNIFILQKLIKIMNNEEYLENATIDEAIVYLQRLSKDGYGDYILENVRKNISKYECCSAFPERKTVVLGIYAVA